MMTRAGWVSAWLAALVGATLAAYSTFWFSAGIIPWLFILAAALLLIGAFRTLRKHSGGLRLLCSAWGYTAGLFIQITPPPESVMLHAPNGIGFVLGGISYIALFGLAFAVLHKEQK